MGAEPCRPHPRAAAESGDNQRALTRDAAKANASWSAMDANDNHHTTVDTSPDVGGGTLGKSKTAAARVPVVERQG